MHVYIFFQNFCARFDSLIPGSSIQKSRKCYKMSKFSYAAKSCCNSRTCGCRQTDRQTDRVYMLCHFRRLLCHRKSPPSFQLITERAWLDASGRSRFRSSPGSWRRSLTRGVSFAWRIVDRNKIVVVGPSRTFPWPPRGSDHPRAAGGGVGGGFSLVEVSEPPEKNTGGAIRGRPEAT